MKVLLAIDDSKFSEAALRMLVAQHRPQNTRVRVLHVVEPIEILAYTEVASTVGPLIDKLQKENLERGRKLVAGVVKKLHSEGFKADSTVQQGNIRTVVVDVAEKWRADLIVAGSHGRSGLDRFLLGSVSEFVARHAPCSVEIVRIRAKQ